MLQREVLERADVAGDAHRREAVHVPVTLFETGDAIEIERLGERVRRRVLQSSLAVDAAQLVTALVVIWFDVGFAIRPLGRVERQLATRGPRDLEP